MSVSTFTKDPDAKLDYQVNWATWLAGDTISISSWVVPTGITQTTTSNTTTTATIWLEGGTIGRSYDVVNRITTAAGRINDRTIRIYIAEQ